MRKGMSSFMKVCTVVGMQVVTSGCLTGGAGGIFGFLESAGFFSGNGHSDAPTILGSLPSSVFSGGGDGGWGGYVGGAPDLSWDEGNGDEEQYYTTNDDNPGEGTGGPNQHHGTTEGNPGGTTQTAATVHNPEPASIALFGAGLAGLTCLRRRRRTQRS